MMNHILSNVITVTNVNINVYGNQVKEYPIDTDTYTLDFAKDDINIIKSYIKYLYRKNYVYTLDDIVDLYKKTK